MEEEKEENTTRMLFLPCIMSYVCGNVLHLCLLSYMLLHCAMHIHECDACAVRMFGETACFACFHAMCCLRDATLLDSGYEHALLSTS